MQKKLPAILVALVVVGVLAWLGLGSLGNNLVYYWSPAELAAAGPKAEGAVVRLGGLVKAGTVKMEGNSTTFQVVEPGSAAEVTVRTKAIPPQMFREGIGVVVEGAMGPDGVFESKRLLVKHDENYKAPADGKMSEDLYKSAQE